jgi:hypothetical protein
MSVRIAGTSVLRLECLCGYLLGTSKAGTLLRYLSASKKMLTDYESCVWKQIEPHKSA